MLTPILLFVILTALLYVPPVQNWVVQKVVAYASEQTGMHVSVDRVSLEFPLDLGVEGFRIVRPAASPSEPGDTIADIGKLVADVQLRPLLGSKVVINALELNNAKVNTSDLVAAARVDGSLGRLSVAGRSIDLGAETVDLSDVELSDADIRVALNDSVPEDTTSTAALWKISVDRIGIERSGVALTMPGDTLRVQAYMGRLAVLQGSFDLGVAEYAVGSIVWDDGTLAYDDLKAGHTEGLDPGHIALSGINISIDSVYYRAPDARLNISRWQMKERSGIEVTQLTDMYGWTPCGCLYRR